MPPTKRKPRRSKPAGLQLATSDVEMPDSSPTRPSAKKRKGNNGQVTKRERSASPLPDEDEDNEDDDFEERSSRDLLEKVISYLAVSKEPVIVARQHANEGLSDDHKISAFAKMAGRDWTYFVREQTINIGRPPDDRQIPLASSPIHDLKDQFPVHIDLGPSKIVSRHHASIFYDADWPPNEGGWHIRVNGRNGVRVNNVLLRRSQRQHIKSGTVLEISGTQMMFVTPDDKVEIDPYFVEKAEAAENGVDLGPAATVSEDDDEEEKRTIGNELPGYQSLAPAPPNLKKAGTPPQLGGKGHQGVFDSKPGTSPVYGRGMMMESTQEIDYSRDTAKDLKPPYSYAHMIAQAIFASEDQKLTLSNIYSFIADKYAFYRYSNSGWQNSIRHNLSLNKAFQKVPRRTDEPGKGMKWQIAPEFREEYWKKQQRRTGTSSNPSSPASKEVNPNFRGANGQNLGYDTSMVYQFSAKDATGQQALPKLNMSFPPFPANNAYHQGPMGPSSQPIMPTSTPQRRRADTSTTLPDVGLEDSPLPGQYPSSVGGADMRGGNGHPNHPYYTLPTSAGPQPHHSPTNPTLSSSYLDTPFHPSQSSMLTPAPLRQNPKLAPPSTLVAPSKFMPESSPAGPGLYWKGFLGGLTPGPHSAIPPDMSPEKSLSNVRGRRADHPLDDRNIFSSSPPPGDSDGALSGSPSKPARAKARPSTGNVADFRVNPSSIPPPASMQPNPTTNIPRLNGVTPTAGGGGLTAPALAASTTFNSKLNTFPPLGPSSNQPPPPHLPPHQSRPSFGQHSGNPGPSATTTGIGAGPTNSSGSSDNNIFGPPRTSSAATTSAFGRNSNASAVLDDENDDGDGGGFDLAKGFAPIGGGSVSGATGTRV